MKTSLLVLALVFAACARTSASSSAPGEPEASDTIVVTYYYLNF